MSENITVEDARSFINQSEITQRDDGMFTDLQEILGRYNIAPEKLTRDHLKRFIKSRLEMGMSMAGIAQELTLPVELVPFLVNVILGEKGLDELRMNQARRFAALAGILTPQALVRLEQIISNGKDADAMKGITLAAQLLQAVGPQTVINNQQNQVSVAPSKEIMERYDPANLERLLGRKIEVIEGAGNAAPQLAQPGDSADGDLDDEEQHSSGVRLDVLDPRPPEDGQ